MSKELATQKERRVQGGNVNYYLVIIPGKNGLLDITVEVEDIIEYLQMSFAVGNVFKALVRICKLRQDLGKPGSNALYEAEKIFYYTNRTLEISKARYDHPSWINGLFHYVVRLFPPVYINDRNPVLITVPRPKRLEPYAFIVQDFIDALLPSKNEAILLGGIIAIARMRLLFGPTRQEEVDCARGLVNHAKIVKSRETLAGVRRDAL